MIYPLVPFSIVLSDPWPIQGHGVTIDALDVLCAQLTRGLFAIAKLLLKVLLQKGSHFRGSGGGKPRWERER